MSQPLNQSDIIFPHLSNTPNFSSTLSSLKRSALSITNRLNSITKDSKFVTNVAASYGLPLVANERCGSWYIPLELKESSVYFKSTDGHMGEWAFSLRRLNLQLLDVLSQRGGCVIVDSTRRGKSMPDALSKTVPLWCSVINRAVFREEWSNDQEAGLFTPPTAVSESEHIQMEKRISGFAQQFLEICKPDILALRTKLKKPLRPLWVTQTSTLPDTKPDFPDFYPVVLCTASRRVQGAEASEGGYIQGAADDHEAWSYGLTPSLFWSNKDELLHTNENDLPTKIAELVNQNRGSDAVLTLIRPTSTLYVSASQNVDLTSFNTVISCTPKPLSQALLKYAGVRAYLHLPCQSGKLGSRDLRTQLPALRQIVSISLAEEGAKKTLICCPTGEDLSVGTALGYLCLFVDGEGKVHIQGSEHTTAKQMFTEKGHTRNIDKLLIKQRLSWITTSNPALNPSRATLQSVNSVLMSSEQPSSPLPKFKNPTLYDQEWNPLPRPFCLVPMFDHSECTTTSCIVACPGNNPLHRPPYIDCNKDGSHKQFDARFLFNRLSNTTWSFTRTLRSVLPSHPSGTVVGTATFSETPLSYTLLYTEEGEFTTDTKLKFIAKKKYVYQLITDSASSPRIVVKFFDDTNRRSSIDLDGLGVGGLFVEMGLLEEERDSNRDSDEDPCRDLDDDGLKALLVAKNKEHHLCGEDLYSASWRFAKALLNDKGDLWWEVRYDVKGPRKDYVSSTRYVPEKKRNC